ncbi:MAG TPA: response regulator transcription factor [Terriglobales bacterium]|nr:response regulator transcription factor [Terriglobales bacterium]
MLKLVVADKQPVFRAGIAKVLAVEDEMRIVAQVQQPEQMMMALERFRPNVVVCSSAFYPDLHDLAAATARAKGRLVIVAEAGENPTQYLSTGAHGVVYRNVTGPSLLQCVRAVARGDNWVQDNTVPAEVSENDMVGARVVDRLTHKELRIVALIVQGYKNKEIATELGTTEQVIKNYLRNVYDKIGVSDRLELALFTIHHRILAEAAAASSAGASSNATEAR